MNHTERKAAYEMDFEFRKHVQEVERELEKVKDQSESHKELLEKRETMIDETQAQKLWNLQNAMEDKIYGVSPDLTDM